MPNTVSGENRKVVEPVGLALNLSLVKDHLEVDHTLDDTLITSLIKSATGEVEERANRSMLTQTRVQYVGDQELASLSGKSINLNFGPIQEFTSASYIDVDGATQTLPTGNYRTSLPLETMYFYGDLPTLAEGPGTVWAQYVTGYGDTETDVPEQWKNIILTLVFHKYDNRGGGEDPRFYRMIDAMVVAAGGSRRA